MISARGFAAILVIACGCTKTEPPAPLAAPSGTAPTAAASPSPSPSPSSSPSSAASASASDSVDRLVARLSANPLWINGLSPQIELPESAPTERVVAGAFEHVSFNEGKVTKHTIVLSKPVRIGTETREYTAVVLDTNLGRKIMLLRYEGPKTHWWSRVFPDA